MGKVHSLRQKALWQCSSILLLALVIAVISNHLRNDGISLIGDWSQTTSFQLTGEDDLVIPLDAAEQLFHKNQATFLDARSNSEYAQGHISGALSLPWQDVDQAFPELTNILETRNTIITYCDGETCDLSHELALFLKEMGYENVQVLSNGWTAWKTAGLPTKTGHHTNGQ